MYRRSRTESCGAIILKWHSNAFSSERVFTMQRRSWTAQRHFTCNSQTVKCPMKLQGHSDSEHLELKMGKSLICCLKVEIVFDLFKFYIVRQEWKETIRLCFLSLGIFRPRLNLSAFDIRKINMTALPSDSPLTLIPFDDYVEEAGRKRRKAFYVSKATLRLLWCVMLSYCQWLTNQT